MVPAISPHSPHVRAPPPLLLPHTLPPSQSTSSFSSPPPHSTPLSPLPKAPPLTLLPYTLPLSHPSSEHLLLPSSPPPHSPPLFPLLLSSPTLSLSLTPLSVVLSKLGTNAETNQRKNHRGCPLRVSQSDQTVRPQYL